MAWLVMVLLVLFITLLLGSVRGVDCHLVRRAGCGHHSAGECAQLGALYLGGNADLYVLYDPCVETVRFVPVGSSRVMFIDEVTCPAP
jgi:hypothetical protein